MERVLEPVFLPLKSVVASVYDLFYDAAEKVWALAKPVAMIGLLFDLMTAKLGWISTILGYYRQFMQDTSGASTLVLVLGAAIVLAYMSGSKKRV